VLQPGISRPTPHWPGASGAGLEIVTLSPNRPITNLPSRGLQKGQDYRQLVKVKSGTIVGSVPWSTMGVTVWIDGIQSDVLRPWTKALPSSE